MICPVCGAKVDDDSLFCSVCGSRMEPHGPEGTEEIGNAGSLHVNGTMVPEAAQKQASKMSESDSKEGLVQSKKAGDPVIREETDRAQTVAGRQPSAENRTGTDTKTDTAEKDPEKEGAAPAKQDFWKKRIPGLAAGAFFIVLGFVRIVSAGTSISSTSFGGDFYTYTYQGIVAVTEVLASIEVTLGWILVAIGVVIETVVLR